MKGDFMIYTTGGVDVPDWQVRLDFGIQQEQVNHVQCWSVRASLTVPPEHPLCGGEVLDYHVLTTRKMEGLDEVRERILSEPMPGPRNLQCHTCHKRCLQKAQTPRGKDREKNRDKARRAFLSLLHCSVNSLLLDIYTSGGLELFMFCDPSAVFPSIDLHHALSQQGGILALYSSLYANDQARNREFASIFKRDLGAEIDFARLEQRAVTLSIISLLEGFWAELEVVSWSLDGMLQVTEGLLSRARAFARRAGQLHLGIREGGGSGQGVGHQEARDLARELAELPGAYRSIMDRFPRIPGASDAVPAKLTATLQRLARDMAADQHCPRGFAEVLDQLVSSADTGEAPTPLTLSGLRRLSLRIEAGVSVLDDFSARFDALSREVEGLNKPLPPRHRTRAQQRKKIAKKARELEQALEAHALQNVTFADAMEKARKATATICSGLRSTASTLEPGRRIPVTFANRMNRLASTYRALSRLFSSSHSMTFSSPMAELAIKLDRLAETFSGKEHVFESLKLEIERLAVDLGKPVDQIRQQTLRKFIVKERLPRVLSDIYWTRRKTAARLFWEDLFTAEALGLLEDTHGSPRSLPRRDALLARARRLAQAACVERCQTAHAGSPRQRVCRTCLPAGVVLSRADGALVPRLLDRLDDPGRFSARARNYFDGAFKRIAWSNVCGNDETGLSLSEQIRIWLEGDGPEELEQPPPLTPEEVDQALFLRCQGVCAAGTCPMEAPPWPSEAALAASKMLPTVFPDRRLPSAIQLETRNSVCKYSAKCSVEYFYNTWYTKIGPEVLSSVRSSFALPEDLMWYVWYRLAPGALPGAETDDLPDPASDGAARGKHFIGLCIREVQARMRDGKLSEEHGEAFILQLLSSFPEQITLVPMWHAQVAFEDFCAVLKKKPYKGSSAWDKKTRRQCWDMLLTDPRGPKIPQDGIISFEELRETRVVLQSLDALKDKGREVSAPEVEESEETDTPTGEEPGRGVDPEQERETDVFDEWALEAQELEDGELEEGEVALNFDDEDWRLRGDWGDSLEEEETTHDGMPYSNIDGSVAEDTLLDAMGGVEEDYDE